MDKNEILNKLQKIFRDVFDNNEIDINEETVAEDIDEWDSLSHVQIVKDIEYEFGIKLTAKEFMSWDNIGEMVDSILCKIQK